MAAFIAARLDEKPLDEALRAAVAAGTASILEVGAGRFDPREAGRLRSNVHVEELIYPDEIHDFLMWKSWIRAYRATEEFFGRQLAK